jgi:DNA-binding response OmpR family regulator
MLSADATERQMDRLLAGGAARYLTKPVRVAGVLEMIDDLVPRRSAAVVPLRTVEIDEPYVKPA